MILVDQCGPYCAACGDCIRCFGDQPCYYSSDGEHWVDPEE